MQSLRIRHYIILSFVVFLVFAVIGFFSSIFNKQGAVLIAEAIAKNLEFIKNANSFYLLLFIFLNNALKAFLALILGAFFGIFPILFLMVNGYVMGIVLVAKIDLGWKMIFASLLPHGIFELAGVFMACGYGMWLGHKFYRFTRFDEKFRPFLAVALKSFFRIVVPILMFAAIIETYLTKNLINLIK